MICQTCHGEGHIFEATEQNEAAGYVRDKSLGWTIGFTCYDCGGTGRQSCCDGAVGSFCENPAKPSKV